MKKRETQAEKLQKLLRRIQACPEARKWARGKTLVEAWNQCNESSWMWWFCRRMSNLKGWPTSETLTAFFNLHYRVHDPLIEWAECMRRCLRIPKRLP